MAKKLEKFTVQKRYLAELDGTLNFVAANVAEVADTIADNTADPKARFF